MDDELTAYINNFAKTSFRDVADQDYIAARFAYQAKLDYQFLWCGLQAIEKYLKGILVFNQQSSKKLGHNLQRSLERVLRIEDIEFDFPEDVIEFIAYINDYGADRYFVKPKYLRENALLNLDRTVWHIRRYCFYMRGESSNKDGSVKQLLPLNMSIVTNAHYKKFPHKYQLTGGYLEKVLKKNSVAKNTLVWKNFYFGKIKKNRIKKFPLLITTSRPIHSLRPHIISELEKLAELPKDVIEYFKEQEKKKEKKE